MKIAVIGTSGRTGIQVARAAIAAGHQVIAVVREPARFTGSATQVVAADGLSAEQLTSAIRGVDAVVSCIGPGRDTPPDIQASSITATIEAMRATGIERIVAITASGPFTAGDNPITRFIAKPILWRIFDAGWRDMIALEAILRPTTLDWTIMRPPMLLDGPGKGRYKSRRGDLNVRWGFSIIRADLAHAIVDVLGDDSSIRTTVSVAN